MDDARRLGDRLDQVVLREVGARPTAATDVPGYEGVPWIEVPADVRAAYWEKQNADAAEEWRALRAERLLSRLDGRYRDAEPRHAKTRRWLELYREGRCANFLIHGPTGCGKTWELAGLVRSLLLEDLVPALLESVPAVMARLKPGGGQGLEAELASFQAQPVLALDDLGTEQGTEWRDVTMYRLLDYRLAHNLPTVFTSNLGPEQLAQRYDDRLFRRMFEGAGRLAITDRPEQAPKAFGTKL